MRTALRSNHSGAPRSPFDGIHRGPHTRGDAFSPTRRPVQETSVDPSAHSHHRMSDGIALASPGNRWPGGHRAALRVSIDVDGPHGELNDQPPANWYDISQTDDDPTGVERLLHQLADTHVRGTCCWVGRAAEDQPDLVRRAVAEGHEIALHSRDHRGYRAMSPAEQREDLLRRRSPLVPGARSCPPARRQPAAVEALRRILLLRREGGHAAGHLRVFARGPRCPPSRGQTDAPDPAPVRHGLSRPFAFAVARLLDYAVDLSDVWIARADEIARWWRTQSAAAEPVKRLTLTQEP